MTSPFRSRSITLATSAVLVLVFSLPTNVGQQAMGQEPAAAPLGPLNPANWKMPSFQSLLPGAEEKTRIKKKKDGLFQELTQSVSGSWNRTKAVFNPQKLNPANFFTASAKTPSPKSSDAKPGFFRSLFTPGAKSQETGTVNDFLAQPRPNTR